ncbi:response regulator [Brevundimonas sp. GCM10030266]|uniref:response regulator n=1 Tax=Brevundimonas sp. GCM10030266 TaxID=3273386 RepID=UPI0036083F57
MAQSILIAEDEADIRELFTLILSSAGYEVTTVADGVEALTRLAYAPPSMVILDLNMPRVDGLEVLAAIRTVEAWKDVPVLVLTASGTGDNLVAARRLGARGYLLKPLTPSGLVERVEQVLGDKTLIWLDDITRSRTA